MHTDVAMNLFYYVLSALCLINILLWIIWNRNKNKFMFDQFGLENTFVVFCVGLVHSSFGLMKYPYTNTTHVFQTDQTLILFCYNKDVCYALHS